MTKNELFRIAREVLGKSKRIIVTYNPNALTPSQRQERIDRRSAVKEQLEAAKKLRVELLAFVDKDAKKARRTMQRRLFRAVDEVYDVEGSAEYLRKLIDSAKPYQTLVELDETIHDLAEQEQKHRGGVHSRAWSVGIVDGPAGMFNMIETQGDTAEECAEKLQRQLATV